MSGILRPSSRDTVQLGLAIQERYENVVGSWRRIKKQPLLIPPQIAADLKLCQAMVRRHKKMDYRHSEDELKASRNLAQWTCDVNCELRNQPKTKIQWKS